MIQDYNFNWSELAYGSKKSLKELDAIFIAAPREISSARFTQLVKQWLPKGNIVLGIANEEYIDGFAGQPHFRTLKVKTVQPIITKVNNSKTPHKIYTFSYSQRDLKNILEKVKFKHHIFINGSWHKSFHTLAPYYTLVNSHRPYELVSPFINEAEALAYSKQMEKEIRKAFPLPKIGSILSESAMVDVVRVASIYSFDHTFQNGLVLGKKTKMGYTLLATSYNAVVPYQTYAMHYGASRERNFTPTHDISHYDTVHAEVDVIIRAAKDKIDLKSSSIFINTLPCPACARMLSKTEINEVVYQNDHSTSYAVSMLEYANKIVRYTK